MTAELRGGAAGHAPLVLGVDSSTQSTKVEARRIDTGDVVAVGRATHPATEPPRSEQDPRAWWSALVTAVGELGEHRRSVVAVSVAAQQHGLVVTDAEGRPLRAAKLWNDTESAPEATDLVERFGAATWAEATGSVPVAAFTVTKLHWLAAHEPEVLAATEMVFLPHDWLTLRLSGCHVTDRGDASGSGWWSPAGGDLHRELLPDGFHGALPRVLGPTVAAGTITAAAAAELGLPGDVVVGPGTGDNMGAALGLGLRPGDVAISLGTSGTVYAVAERPTADPSGAVAGFADATGRFLPLVCTLNATKVTDTVAGWLGTDPAGLADLALAADPRPAAGLELTPYFDGERTPNLPDATGSLVGLRNSTTREDIALAAHDGVLRGLLHGLDALRAAGVRCDGSVHLVGGGARSAAYRQRLADLLGHAIEVPTAEESVATGAAVQAAVIAWEARGVAGGAAGGAGAAESVAAGAEADPFDAVAQRWGLRAAVRVEPRP